MNIKKIRAANMISNFLLNVAIVLLCTSSSKSSGSNSRWLTVDVGTNTNGF